MNTITTFEENLPALAPLAFAEANRTCGDCRDYHATWVYRRIAGAVGGVESDRPVLVPLIGEIGKRIALRRWLIAGSADSGITATVAMGLKDDAPHTHLTIADRCETPLAVCRAFAQQARLEIATVMADLAVYTAVERYDAVIAHSVLGFFAKASQPQLLRQMRGLLRPGGVLLFCTRLCPDRSKEKRSEHEARTINAFHAAIAAGRLVPPEPADQFEQRLRDVSRHFDTSSNLPSTAEETVALVEDAGYLIQEIVSSGQAARGMRWAPKEASNRTIIVAVEPGNG